MSFPSGPAPHRPSPQSTPPPTRRFSWSRFFVGLLQFVVALGLLAFCVMWWYWGRDLPQVSDLDVLEMSGKTQVFDRRGDLLTTLAPTLSSGKDMNRDLLKLEQISPWLQKAVVTSEDRRFFEHKGVDYIGITRGLLRGLLKNDLQGGSSITQQVIKNTLLVDLEGARTAERKFKEAILAFRIESAFSKDRILNAYLNVAYWGNGGSRNIVGVGAAAQAYFGKTADKLNLAESVYLATLIPSPNRRYKDFNNYRPLMKDLMDRMVEDGRITRAEANTAWATPIYPAGWRIGWNNDGSLNNAGLENPTRLAQNIRIADKYSYRNQHFLQAVENELKPLVGKKALYAGGKIYTTLDLKAQRSAEQASLNARLPDGATLGMALVSPKDGEVLAMVGQKLTGDITPDWNNALQGRRQIGSSIKPLLYALALQNGWKQYDTVLDAPIKGNYQPMNYDRTWLGRPVTLRYALDHSLNLPTVRLGKEVGIARLENKLRQMNFSLPKDAGLSLAIGTLEASPLQLAAAYATFANGGKYYQPSFVRRFEGRKNGTGKKEELLYERPTPTPKRVWDEQTAWLGLDMMMGVIYDLEASQGGLATRARIKDWQVGGKTGTTNDIRDVWFAGVTPEISGAVWVGKQEGGNLPSWVTSGEVPTPIWQQAMSGALQGLVVTQFQQPAGISYQWFRNIKMAVRNKSTTSQPAAQAEQKPASVSSVGNSTNDTNEANVNVSPSSSQNSNQSQSGLGSSVGAVIEQVPNTDSNASTDNNADNTNSISVEEIPVLPAASAGTTPNDPQSQPWNNHGTVQDGQEVPVMPAGEQLP